MAEAILLGVPSLVLRLIPTFQRIWRKKNVFPRALKSWDEPKDKARWANEMVL